MFINLSFSTVYIRIYEVYLKSPLLNFKKKHKLEMLLRTVIKN